MVAGYRRALRYYPVESRFFLFLTGVGTVGLLLQKESLVEGMSYAAFWSLFMMTLMCFWHDDLFRAPD